MKIRISTANVKLFNQDDCIEIEKAKCLINESFHFQLFIESEKRIRTKIRIKSDLSVKSYVVKKMKGDYYLDKETDDYYVYAKDDMYPDLLQEREFVCVSPDNGTTVFCEIGNEDKTVGKHKIEITLGDSKKVIELEVLNDRLVENDLIITHWFHNDCISNYYSVKIFSDEYYEIFEKFVQSYVKMGNTMILVPVFTPPLDTAVGAERLTAQLVDVEKDGGTYYFDYHNFDKYITICQNIGIKYFELSHLFTQWGAKYCPKILIKENGVVSNHFGWEIKSTDERYLDFLSQYLKSIADHLKKIGIFDITYMHLTDEPHGEDIKTYIKLSEFIKKKNYNLKTLDAISHYDIVKSESVNLPAVCTRSKEFDLFKDVAKLIYYCIDIDDNYLSNRYFHMPLQRTEIIGFQIYELNAKGFLQWGYNFYNTQLSKKQLNPYKNTTAGGAFCAGDSFLVYPGKSRPEYSLRYFILLKAFEEYRLLKTLERKYDRAYVMSLLHNQGIEGVRKYPRDAKTHNEFVNFLKSLL